MVGFAGHACFPSIKLSLSNQEDYNAVLNTSYLVCFTFYTSIAILGYLMYGVNVDEEITFNIMNSVKGKSVSQISKSVANLATWLVAVNPCTKFGLTMNPVALLVEAWRLEMCTVCARLTTIRAGVLGRMEFVTSRPHPNLSNEAF